jgi:hypothetical protein
MACHRPEPVPPATPKPTSPEVAVVVPDARELDAYEHEVPDDAPPDGNAAEQFDIGKVSIGPLHLALKDVDAVRALGRPKSKSKPILMGATGDYVGEWDWGDVSLQMAGATEKGPFLVVAINVAGRSAFKTDAGIGVGSTRDEVRAVYGNYFAHTEDPDTLLVGSIYGGLMLHLERDRVTAMYLGALAF